MWESRGLHLGEIGLCVHVQGVHFEIEAEVFEGSLILVIAVSGLHRIQTTRSCPFIFIVFFSCFMRTL